MAPSEPFKFFHKVNASVQRRRLELEERLDEMGMETEMVSTPPGGPTRRPAGLAQLGYACFWPEGGGQQEGNDRLQRQRNHDQPNRSNGFQDAVRDRDEGAVEKEMDTDTNTNTNTYDVPENANPPADRERTPSGDTALPSQ
jgi:hypothetical protein